MMHPRMEHAFPLLVFLASISSLIAVPGSPQRKKIFYDNKVEVHTFTVDEQYVSLFAVTAEGILVVEPVSVEHSRLLLLEIRKVSSKPIKYLIYTHNHWDHEGGGQIFRDVGARLVAHEEAIEYYKYPGNLRVPDVVMPDLGWPGTKRGDKYVITLGGVNFELIYLGQSHGFGMCTVYMPAQRIAYFADIVNQNRMMFTIVPDFNTQEWQATLFWILDNMDFNMAVCAHGMLDPGDRQTVQNQHDLIVDMRNKINSMIAGGIHPLAVPNLITLPKYQSYANYKDWLPMNAWRMVMERWMGPWPFRPNWPDWKPKGDSGGNDKDVNVNVNVKVQNDSS